MPTDGEIRELNAKMAGDYAKVDADFLRAENARLQERVEEADEVVGRAIVALKERVRGADLLKRERDDYRALLERAATTPWKSWVEDVRAYLAQPMTKCEEREGELVAIKGRLLEIVEECEEIGEDPSYLFSMLDIIDSKILDSITEVLK